MSDPVPEISHAIEAVSKIPLKEHRPLLDVRGYAATKGKFLEEADEIDVLMQAFGPVSQVDLDWKSSPCYPQHYVAKLRGITVLPGSRVLLSPEGSALSDELEFGFRMFGLRPKRWEMEITAGPNLFFEPAKGELSLIPYGIHLTGEHEANYFHWIAELLPRLFLCEKLLIGKQIPVLVTEGLNDNLYALLEIVRDPARAVVKLKMDCHYYVEQLIYPSDLSRIFDTYDRAPGTDTTYLPVALLKAMATEIKGTLNATKSDHGKAIFVKRNSNYRKLLNEPEVESLLIKRGFSIVEPEKLTIEQQIGIFSQSEIIVGPSGAGMANILWCKPGTRIFILHSDHPFKKYPYWDAFARASETKIHYLAGPRAHNVTDIFEAHDDFEIDPEQLLRVLENPS